MAATTTNQNNKARAYKKLAALLQAQGITKKSHKRYFFTKLEDAENTKFCKSYVKVVERKYWLDIAIYTNGKLISCAMVGYEGYESADSF